MREPVAAGGAAELDPRAVAAEELRAQLRELLDTQRRVVRVGETQVEVVEVLLLERLLEGPPPTV